MVQICLPDLYLDVPCGKCYECQKRRMRDYMIRLLYELSEHPNSYFVTLTFDDEHLDKFRNDPNKAVRLFLDRFRKLFNNKQVRHWFVAEYGTKHGRIHYHGFLFDLPFGTCSFDDINRIISSSWKYGYVYASKVQSDGAARYVCKYVTKAYSVGYEKPPRILSSFGIGKSYLTYDNIKWHKDTDGYLRPYILKGGYKISLPRYFSEKIYNDLDKAALTYQRYLDKEQGDFKYNWKGVAYPTEQAYISARSSDFNRNVELGLSQPYKQKFNSNKQLKSLNYEQFTNSTGLQKESEEIGV